jgi:hypothetical protein
MKRIASLFVLTCVLLLGFPQKANAADDIDRAVKDVKAIIKSGGSSETDAKLRSLDEAVAEGEKASARLRSEIADLEREKSELQQERSDLQRVQSILASGLIGALVTAVVAVLGAISSRGRSKAERDLKRLEVLEKSRSLQKSGIDIPADIIRHYHASPTPASGTAEGHPQP